MIVISQGEKDRRFLFMKDMAEEVIDNAVLQTIEQYGKEQGLQIRASLLVSDSRLRATVDYYYHALLHDYKDQNGYFSDERLSGRDKLAALTAIAILTLTPIDVKPYEGRSIGVAEANETFALYFASTVLHVDLNAPCEDTPAVPGIVARSMLLNLRDLGQLARRRASRRSPIQSTEPLADWIIQAMQLYALAFGKIDLRL